MTDAHGVARDQLRAFVERIERLEEEKKTIADDIKDVYGEAKSMGFDTKILKMVISLRKKDEQQRTEEEIILDTYLQALGMIPAFEREEDQPKTAKEVPAQDGGGTGLSESSSGKPNAARPVSVDTQPNGRGSAGQAGESVVTVVGTESGTVANSAPATQGEADAPSDERVSPNTVKSCAAANTGGDYVSEPRHAQTHQAGGVSITPANHLLRPHCLNRELCRSGTADHCHTCKKAMASGELEPA